MCQHNANYKPSIFANKLENSAPLNYCPVQEELISHSLFLHTMQIVGGEN